MNIGVIGYLERFDIAPENLDDALNDYGYGECLEDWPEVIWAKHPKCPSEEAKEAARILTGKAPMGTWEAYKGAQMEQVDKMSPVCPVATKSFKLVHRQGGGEGQGEHVERVWQHLPSGRFLRATASYYSYDGISGWSDFEYVKPVEVTVTKYVAEES